MKIYHSIIRAMTRTGNRLLDIILGSRDAMEFWQALFAVWWGSVMMFSRPSLLFGPVYEPLISVAPDFMWGAMMGLSGLGVMVGLFVNDVFHVNGGAMTLRRWGMTAHMVVLLFVWVAFLDGHGWVGSTAVPAYGILSGSAIAITIRHWICKDKPC